MLLLKKPRILDTSNHSSSHAQMYADLFLFTPWVDEEAFLGEARQSLEACKKLWYIGPAALEIKQHLMERIKQSLLLQNSFHFVKETHV